MKKRNIRKERLIKLVGLIVIFLIISNFIPTPYMVTSPGIAQELSPLVTVKDGYKGKSSGDFMLTAVSSKRANVLDYIYISLFDPAGYDLSPRQQQIPAGMKMEEYINIMAALMEESKVKAQAVALKKAGYEVNLKESGDGAEIVQVVEGGSAEKKLKSGDIIVSVNGKKVELATDAVNLIREKKIGERVDITVRRDGETKSFQLETVEIEGQPNKPSIGVIIITKNLSYNFPRETIFHTENIVGPSAGGMFTLEIYNQLIEKDITNGQKIAGTGTISSDGTIGMIDGILQKIIAADKAGAELFLVPEGNYEEAQKTDREIKLVMIKNIDDAVAYLANY